MGVFKDALFTEVWMHLKRMPGNKAMLSSLNHPQNGQTQIRDAWKALQDNGQNEGMNKSKGLKVVLQERQDLFVFEPTPSGHPFVALSPALRAYTGAMLPPVGALPAAPAASASLVSTAEEQLLSESGVTAEELAAVEAALLEGTSPEEAERLMRMANIEELAANQKRVLEATQGGSAKKKKKTGGGTEAATAGKVFRDLIWTPYLAEARAREQAASDALRQALIEALQSYDGETVALSQLGFDFKVAQIRKNSKEKLLDTVKRYEDVFELTPDSIKGGYNINFQPGFDIDGAMRGSSAAQLPRRLNDPRNLKEKYQSLRIEIIYALYRRGGKSTVAELGQEPPVQRRKSSIGNIKKLQDFIQIFPGNFGCTPNAEGIMTVDLVGTSVEDQMLIDLAIQKQAADAERARSKGKGKGKGRPGGQPLDGAMAMPQPQTTLPWLPTGLAVPGMALGFSSVPPASLPALAGFASAFAAPIQQNPGQPAPGMTFGVIPGFTQPAAGFGAPQR